MNLKKKILVALTIGALNCSCADRILLVKTSNHIVTVGIKEQPISDLNTENFKGMSSVSVMKDQNHISKNGHQTVLK